MPDIQPTPRDELAEIVLRDPQSSGGDPTWTNDLLDAYEQHIRAQVAREIERSEFQRGPFSGSNHYLGGYTDALADAARIARQEA